MSEDCEILVLDFKRGDDLKLDFTVQDLNNDAAIAQLSVLTEAEETLAELQEADPVDQSAIDAQQIVVNDEQAAYDALIIVDITGWTIISQVRRGGKLIATLDVTIVDATSGTFTLTQDNLITVDWPVADLECDIEFITTSGKNSSETFIIHTKRDITR